MKLEAGRKGRREGENRRKGRKEITEREKRRKEGSHAYLELELSRTVLRR